MARKSKQITPSGYAILLVDDNSEYLKATRFLLENEGHTLYTAANGPEALDLLKQKHIDLVLLDYYMPGMRGDEVVTKLRLFNPHVQVILQTGYANEQPPRELLHRLDIQGYFDKSEGPDKLLLWADVGLKAAYSMQLLEKSHRGLQYILDVTPDLHKIQPLTELLQGILWQVAGLLGAVNSFIAILDGGGLRPPQDEEPEGFLAMIEEDADLVIRASTGRFSGHEKLDEVIERNEVKALNEALKVGIIKPTPETTIVPLKVGELMIGLIYLDRQVTRTQDRELLGIFANQAAVAIQNAQLYEMATIDLLTGLYVRSFFEKWLSRELRTAFRSQQPVSLLMLDLDKLKHINDQAGHLTGDKALIMVGESLRKATRSTDIVGRFGGDEFAMILPQADLEGANIVGQRIIKSIQEKTIQFPHEEYRLNASLGLAVLKPHSFNPGDIPHPVPPSYFEEMGRQLLQSADEALYQSKRVGGGCLTHNTPIHWLPLNE